MNNSTWNVGKLIKVVAICSFIVEVIAALIAGVAILIETEELWGALVAALGPLAGVLLFVLLYGFGELIDKSCEISFYSRIMAEPIMLEKKERLKKEAEEEAGLREERKAKWEATRKERELAERRALEQVLRSQAENLPAEQAEDRPQPTVPAAKVPKEKTFKEKLSYALAYQTDEGMIGYLKSIGDERLEPILNAPRDQIRQLVIALRDETAE